MNRHAVAITAALLVGATVAVVWIERSQWSAQPFWTAYGGNIATSLGAVALTIGVIDWVVTRQRKSSLAPARARGLDRLGLELRQLLMLLVEMTTAGSSSAVKPTPYSDEIVEAWRGCAERFDVLTPAPADYGNVTWAVFITRRLKAANDELAAALDRFAYALDSDLVTTVDELMSTTVTRLLLQLDAHAASRGPGAPPVLLPLGDSSAAQALTRFTDLATRAFRLYSGAAPRSLRAPDDWYTHVIRTGEAHYAGTVAPEMTIPFAARSRTI